LAEQVYFYGTGRRKEAIARVKLMPGGGGAIIVNGVPYDEVFPRLEQRQAVARPLVVTNNIDRFNAVVKVTGGGVTGQSGAVCHGIARALLKADESFRPTLRQYGLLTRDSRVKERKKPGLKRARKAPQYTKR
jgi:small subunit ribosomal protein S9